MAWLSHSSVLSTGSGPRRLKMAGEVSRPASSLWRSIASTSSVDARVVAGPHAHVGQQAQQVGHEGGAVVAAYRLRVVPVAQPADQLARAGVRQDGRVGGLHLGIVGRPIEQLRQRDPSSRGLVAREQPVEGRGGDEGGHRPQRSRPSAAVPGPRRRSPRPAAAAGSGRCGCPGSGRRPRACRRPRPARRACPPSGPRSMTQSARAMTCRLCSMTTTELPSSHEPVQDAHQPLDVGEVQAGRGLIQDVDVAALAQLRGQLEPLALAAGERRERLAQRQVVQAHLAQQPQSGRDRRARLRAGRRRRCRAAALAEDLQRLAGREPSTSSMPSSPQRSASTSAGSGGPSQSEHSIRTSSRKFISTPIEPAPLQVGQAPCGVEAEERSRPAGGRGEDAPDVVEEAQVGGRVGAAVPPDAASGPPRSPSRSAGRTRRGRACSCRCRPRRSRRPAPAGGCPRPRPAGCAARAPRICQTSGSSAAAERSPTPAAAAASRRISRGGQRVAGQELVARPTKHDLPALAPRARPDLHDVIRRGDDRRIVLDDQHRVALVPQLPQHLDELVDVARRAGRSTARPGRTSGPSGRSRAGGPS